LHPNEQGDWISMRNDSFEQYIPISPEKKFNVKTTSFFTAASLGTVTARDTWVYNFSLATLKNNILKTIEHYNSERELVANAKKKDITANSTLGSWSRDWQNNLKRNKIIVENKNEYRTTVYRPFIKVNSYFDDDLNQERYQLTKIFPQKNNLTNIAIIVTGVGASKPFSPFIVDNIPNYDLIEKSNCFPLYYYEENNSKQKAMFDDDNKNDFIRRDAISDFILERAKKIYGKNVTKEDIFYYVYGFLHSKEYRETFANDLKKMLPRLPLLEDVKDFWAFSKAGRKLAELHLNYETVAPFADAKVTGDDGKFYTVEKLRFPKKDQKDTIIYNSKITISNIPAKAYEYVVNGKSAVEWIMERYQITTHKESGIVNNPNDWATEVGNPRYILDLLLSVINVSVQTVDIVNDLPKIDFDKV
jgi:predicted helicase